MNHSEYDFFRLEGYLPVYIQIEGKLSHIGMKAEENQNFLKKVLGMKVSPKDAWAGFAFKNQVLKAAGWDIDEHGSYTNDPDRAASIFLKLGKILGKTEDPNEILELAAK